jgi:hypothetical protein
LVSSFWSLVPGVVNLGAIENRLDFGVDVSKKSLNSSSSNADGEVFLLNRDIRCLSLDGLKKLGLFDLSDELSVAEGRKKLDLASLSHPRKGNEYPCLIEIPRGQHCLMKNSMISLTHQHQNLGGSQLPQG